MNKNRIILLLNIVCALISINIALNASHTNKKQNLRHPYSFELLRSYNVRASGCVLGGFLGTILSAIDYATDSALSKHLLFNNKALLVASSVCTAAGLYVLAKSYFTDFKDRNKLLLMNNCFARNVYNKLSDPDYFTSKHNTILQYKHPEHSKGGDFSDFLAVSKALETYYNSELQDWLVDGTRKSISSFIYSAPLNESLFIQTKFNYSCMNDEKIRSTAIKKLAHHIAQARKKNIIIFVHDIGHSTTSDIINNWQSIVQ